METHKGHTHRKRLPFLHVHDLIQLAGSVVLSRELAQSSQYLSSFVAEEENPGRGKTHPLAVSGVGHPVGN